MGGIRLWKEEYRMGNEKVDAQHQELFRKIESLLVIATTADAEKNRHECMEIIEFLISYTKHHFETEEALQRELGYVSYKEHVKLHEQFANTVLTYKERVETHFSKETLKKFVGTLLTWLVMHVRGCDLRIMTNRPIDSKISFNDVEELLRHVATQILTDAYGIAINKATACVYNGDIEGKVIVRTIIKSDKDYVFLYGFSEEMAKTLYHKISGLVLNNIEMMDIIEKSALIEMGDFFSSHALTNMSTDSHTKFEWKGDVFVNEYSDSCIDTNNSVMLELETDCGKMEIMYCLIED